VHARALVYQVDLTKYTEMHSFAFHEAFDEHCSNDFIYCSTVQRVVVCLRVVLWCV